MPKATRTRINHLTPPLSKRQFSLPENHSQRLLPDQPLPTSSANEILRELDDPQAYVSSNSTKTTKQNPNRTLRARDAVQPYSKSHAKRLKKKAKEQAVVGDMGPVKEALEEVMACSSATATPALASDKDTSFHSQHPPPRHQNNNNTLVKKSISHKQKAKILHHEAARLPTILNHPEFRKNPFAAIRTHIQNSNSLKAS
ncbi:hypothetical protein VP01_131g10 [Puccinia sorghi]|uniref:Ribosome biogenesis protein SLX9 n=1 Tax=Puccinia sorghi TaxID=27349 RepID=A0A0L6VMX8_9BASI|nr:hypothetical protein VP01_131g10 [Puccinia sorghi]